MKWTRSVVKNNGEIRKRFEQWGVPKGIRRKLGLDDGSECTLSARLGTYYLKPREYVLTSDGEFRLPKKIGGWPTSAKVIKIRVPRVSFLRRGIFSRRTKAMLKMHAANNDRRRFLSRQHLLIPCLGIETWGTRPWRSLIPGLKSGVYLKPHPSD